MNITPKWIVEEFAFHEHEIQLKNEIEKQGMVCEIVDRKTSIQIDYNNPQPAEFPECVIFYGSLDFCSKLSKKHSWWVPGNYCNLPNYDCTKYYPALSKYLLNESYVMLPYGELLRRKEFLFDTLGIDDCLFIRPNSGKKSFTGKLVKKEFYEKDVDYFGFYGIAPHELVVVAEPRNILHEWRFICVDGKVVTGSMYQFMGESYIEYAQNPVALELAQDVAKDYNPDRVWAIDICATKGGQYYLLEIGCFSSAGLYACDLGIIVREVSAAAKKEFREIFDEEYEKTLKEVL